jgi:ABC-type dipeptide/oligopeptide/nickel transport system permease subunit
MTEERPRYIENRQFVGYEEEDIQKLNKIEQRKFGENLKINEIMDSVVQELGTPGRWEEHWLTIDDSGRRVFARIYYSGEQALALTSDGQIVREVSYPADADILKGI